MAAADSEPEYPDKTTKPSAPRAEKERPQTAGAKQTVGPSPPIVIDLFCIRCQYNLRTKTMQDICPECGTAVALSVTHRRDHAEALVHPRLFRGAAVVFAAAMFLGVLNFFAVYGLRYYSYVAANPDRIMNLELIVNNMAQLIFVGATVAGVFCVGTAVGRHVIPPGVRGTMSLVVAGYAILNLVTVLLSFSLLSSRRWFRILESVRTGHLVCAVMYLILVIMGLYAMKRLARALAMPQLRTATTLAFGAALADASLAVGVYAWIRTWPRGLAGTDRENFIFSADLFSTMVAALFGIYWIYVARLRTTPEDRGGGTRQEGTGVRAGLSPEEKVAQFLNKPPRS